MDRDLKRIAELSSEAIGILRRRTRQEAAKLKRRGLKNKEIAEYTKRTAIEAIKEGRRLKGIYGRELSLAMKRLEKLAKIEAGVIARKIKTIRKKK